MNFRVLLFLCLCLPGLLLTAAPALDAGFKMVPLHNGPNSVDLDSDGRADTVLVAERENYNAHSFEVTSIYVWAAATKGGPVALHIVPVWPVDDGRRHSDEDPLHLIASGGADGLLHDFRLFIDAAHHEAVLLVATRKYGQSFADRQTVTFEYYKLTRNVEEAAGLPTLYFKFYQKTVSAKLHQDVNEAFRSELGVKSDGRHPFAE